MLNLDDEKAIDYSSEIAYFPYDTYGTFDLMVLSYEESGPANSEKNKSDKEFDVFTVEVLASDNDVIKAGERYVFWFQTGGDGVNQKNRAYKAADLRKPVVAMCGVSPKDPGYKTFAASTGRKELLARDFGSKETGIRLKATQGNERKGDENKGTFYTDKAWNPLA